MNYYISYFNQETLVTTLDDAVAFLSSIEDIAVTPDLINSLRAYIEGELPYPKRFNIRSRVYFTVIKTDAASLEEFHSRANDSNSGERKPVDRTQPAAKSKSSQQALLLEQNPGWYEATLVFKRVIVNPETRKFAYVDTPFSVRAKAYSGQDCYERMVAHLQSRPDIDPRCQYPAAHGKNFSYKFLGMTNAVSELVEGTTDELTTDKLTTDN